MTIRDAFAEVLEGFRSQADADLTLQAAGDGARLTGTLTITSGAYREPITAMARRFSAPKAAPVRSGASPLGAVELDVRLTASTPIVIENSAGRIDLVPNVSVRGTLAEPRMFGTLDMVDDGRLTLMGRTFRLSEARVAFSGDGDPDVLIIGETRVDDYHVTLRAGGPMTDMEASYSSDPPLSERDLRSLLVTGRTADISGSGSADDEMFVLGTASSDILGLAGQMVGLDSVQLGRGDFELGSSDVSPAMRLTVSRMLNDRSRLVLSQDLDNNKLTWILVFVPRRGFEVRLSQRDNLEEVIEFRQEIGFGAGTSPPTGRTRAGGGEVPASRRWSSPAARAARRRNSKDVVKLRPSRTFDVRTWQLDRERLEAFYRDLGFAVARIVPRRTVTSGADGERVHLEYRIDPGPRTLLIVNGIDVSGAERDDLMRTWSQAVLIEFLEEDLTRSLRALLASRNQLRPSIKVKVDAPNAQVVRAQVTIDPGPVTRVRRIVFEGRSAISDSELRAGLEARVDLNAAWVDPGPLTLAVEGIYAERGLPKARAAAQPLRFDGDAAELRVRITEGPAAVVEEIITTGVAEARVEGARSAIGLERGQPVLLSTERDARRRLERFYLDLGFRSARVQSAQTKDPDGRITLRFSVAEGPLSVVTGIEVRGLEATRPGGRPSRDHASARTAGRPAGRRRHAAAALRAGRVPAGGGGVRAGGRSAPCGRGHHAGQDDGRRGGVPPVQAPLRRPVVEPVRPGARGLHLRRRRGCRYPRHQLPGPGVRARGQHPDREEPPEPARPVLAAANV